VATYFFHFRVLHFLFLGGGTVRPMAGHQEQFFARDDLGKLHKVIVSRGPVKGRDGLLQSPVPAYKLENGPDLVQLDQNTFEVAFTRQRFVRMR
jgi:hypothetical protein